MGILCVFCVYDTIGNRCFEKTSFPKMEGPYAIQMINNSLLFFLICIYGQLIPPAIKQLKAHDLVNIMSN